MNSMIQNQIMTESLVSDKYHIICSYLSLKYKYKTKLNLNTKLVKIIVKHEILSDNRKCQYLLILCYPKDNYCISISK